MSQSPENPVYTCGSTQFASYLRATKSLVYLNAELQSGKKVVFLFSDPELVGSELRRNWDIGIVSSVNPKIFLEVRDRLLDEVKKLLREEAKGNR